MKRTLGKATAWCFASTPMNATREREPCISIIADLIFFMYAMGIFNL